MSRGLVGSLLAVVLIAAVVVLWAQLGHRIDHQGDEAANTCVKGKSTVPVIADPDIAGALGAIAQDFNATHPIVRDHCVTVTVRPADAKVTLDGLAGNWDPASMGAPPAAWVPQSSIWAAELASAKPGAVDGTPSSLVTSPVVLATHPRLADALGKDFSWQRLPDLQQTDGSLADVGLGSWGSIRLAVPAGAQSDATTLAAQAVAAQTTHSTGALTAANAHAPEVGTAIQNLQSGAPSAPGGTPVGAAKTIADATDPSESPIHAVAITEQQLYQLTRGDSTQRLAELVPGGPTPVADYPVIHLSGPQVAQEQSETVGEFFGFAGKPAELGKLTALGFRGAAPTPPATHTVSFPPIRTPMPKPENPAVTAIDRLVYGDGFAPHPAPAPRPAPRPGPAPTPGR